MYFIEKSIGLRCNAVNASFVVIL